MLSIKSLPSIPPQGRMVFVGDIHGCIDEFDALLKKIRYNRQNDVLVLVGDLVNKGYDSISVVKRAMELGAHCVLGNHDAALIARCDHIREGEIDPNVPPHSHDPVTATAVNLPRECYKFLTSLPHIILVPQFDVVCVHAGVNPKLPIDGQNLWELLHMRRVLPNGRVTDAQLGGDPWATRWKGPQTIIFGHDAKTGLQKHQFAIGLDTGCCYGGDLTAYILPAKVFESVPGSKKGVAKKPVNASPATAIGYSPSTEVGAAAAGRSPAMTAGSQSPSTAMSLTATLKSLLRVESAGAQDTHHGVPTAAHFPSAPPPMTEPPAPAVAEHSTRPTPVTASSSSGIPAPRSKATPATTTPAAAAPPPSAPKPGAAAAIASSSRAAELPDSAILHAAPRAAPPVNGINGHPKASKRTTPQHAPATPGASPGVDALLQHMVSVAAEMLEAPSGQTRTWALRLLGGDAVDHHREELVEGTTVAPEVWARLVRGLVNHAAAPKCPAREAEEALGWVQDAASNPKVAAVLDRKALSDAIAACPTAPKSAIRSTLIALRA
jgi:bis(5'-nucleosyl)-tetraphosphatase (symmetrical)